MNPFQIAGGMAVEETNKNLDLNSRIKNLIQSSDVFLFMKGTPQMPMCGFSANVVKMLGQLSVNYHSFNILADNDIREGVKAFSNWPTYPQLYIKGELVGGSDIVTELFQTGELKNLITK